jgi:tetratricopeptide (TPR) repeat protein
MSPEHEDRLAALVAEGLARIEAGQPLDTAELCAEHPELEPEVRAALGLRDDVAALHRAAPDAATPQQPILADRYQLLDAIGSGAAGTVWRARDQRLHREVAVKLLHRGLFDGGDAEQRFHREAVVLADHEHPHVVRIYDQGRTDDGTSYLVTELLRGATLADVLAHGQRAMHDRPSLRGFAELDWLRRRLPDAELASTWLRQAVVWAAQLGDGLVAAHERGVCHRDVKPGNAFVRDDGRAVLLDFGIAARAGDAGITRTHTVLGTPCYMAPEQAAGHGEPQPSLDIYGLTATLYHLLTLRPPHAGDLQQVLVSLRDEDPIPADRIVAGLPRDLQAILDRGLERDVRRRYPTMRALVHDLRAFLDHLPVAARPIGRLRRGLRRIRRRPARALAATATVAALLFGGVGVPAWLSMQAHAAELQWRQRHARLPADVCIEGYPDERPLVPVAEQDALLRELDQLVELDDRDLAMRLLRAASRLDYGRLDGARADLRRIAEIAGSDYVREVARRYADAPVGDDGRGVPDLDGLPEPRTRDDHFLAGFHALRARDCERADRQLTACGDYLPAQDLRLLAILGLERRDPQRAITEASRLEGVYGYATARTQHTLAAAHLQLKLYEQALPYCDRSLELRPDRHGPWTNKGFAHLRLGDLAAARRCYERAVELRPWLPNSLSGLCQTLRELGDYDGARAVAQRIADVGWREYELANVELVRALQAHVAGDLAAMHDAAQRAVEHFDAAADDASTRLPKRGSIRASRLLADMLRTDRLQDALTPQLLSMRSEPRNARRIANLSALLADAELTPTLRLRLRLWLLDLAVDLAPENPAYQNQRSELLRRHR